jgi:hypothetical protein
MKIIMQTKISRYLLVLMMAITIFNMSCSDEGDDPAPSNNGNGGNGGDEDVEFALYIESGAISAIQGETFPLNAVKVDINGLRTPVSGVEWSVEDASVGSFNGNTFSASGIGATYITASLTENGVEYTHTIPVSVLGRNILFQIVPGAIIWEVGAGDIPLEPVYLGTGTPDFTFSSGNESVVTVSESGIVSFVSPGETVITANCNSGGQNYTQHIPVLVLGSPPIPLPVTRVTIDPASKNLFLNETVQLNARAFNSSGEEVSGKPIIWSTQNDTIATVDQNGLVSPKAFGRVSIQATIEGISGQAEIFVYPNKVILVEPFRKQIAQGESATFTAETYSVNRQTYLLESNPDPSNPAGLQWWLPFESIPFFPSQAEITSSDNNSATVRIKSSNNPFPIPIPVILEAFVDDPTIGAGGAVIEVGGQGNNCDCGITDPAVASISVNPSSINLDLLFNFQAQIEAKAFDASNTELSGIPFTFCTGDMLVATVDSNGEVSAIGPGSTEITVCHGSFQETISVTVSQ